MKRFITGMALLLPLALAGQSLDRQVTASSGDYATAGNLQLSWTVGEVMVTTESSSNLVITQGFQQPDGMAVGIQSPVNDLAVSLFPNPTEGMLTLKLSSATNREVQLQWFDMLGQGLGKVQIATVNGNYTRTFDLRPFAAGTYFLLLRDAQGRVIESFKVEKLN